MTYFKAYVKDNSFVVGANLLVYAKGIILMPIIIKTVGASIYGGFVMISSILAFAFGVSSLGANFEARRYLPSANSMMERKELFYPQFLFMSASILILSLVLVSFNPMLQKYIFKNEINYTVYVLPIYLISYFLYSQCSDYMRYTRRVHLMTVVNVSFVYMHIGFIIIFYHVFHNINVNTLILLQAASGVIISLPFLIMVLREVGFRPAVFTKDRLVASIKLGFPVVVLEFVIDFILNSIDRYCLTFYIGVAAVGYYVPGYVLGSVVILIPKAMAGTLPQLLSRAVDNGDEEAAQKMLSYSLKIFLMVAIPFVFGSAIMSKPLLQMLANKEVAENAFLVTPIVALGTLFYGCNMIMLNVLFVKLKTYSMAKINAVGALLCIVSNVVFLHFFKSLLVSAFTMVVCHLFMFVCARRVVGRIWSVNFQLNSVARAVLASILMFGVLLGVDYLSCSLEIFVRIALMLMTGVAVYAAALYYLGVFTAKELAFIKGIVSR